MRRRAPPSSDALLLTTSLPSRQVCRTTNHRCETGGLVMMWCLLTTCCWSDAARPVMALLLLLLTWCCHYVQLSLCFDCWRHSRDCRSASLQTNKTIVDNRLRPRCRVVITLTKLFIVLWRPIVIATWWTSSKYNVVLDSGPLAPLYDKKLCYCRGTARYACQ